MDTLSSDELISVYIDILKANQSQATFQQGMYIMPMEL